MKTWRRALLVAAMLCLSASARAGVYLSSYDFSISNLPYIYTDENLPTPYRLRAKIDGGFHAANGWNNNWCRLDGVPGTGTHTIDLYWLKYAPDYSTLLEIGPFYSTTIYIRGDNNAPTVNWTSTPAEANCGQSYFIQAHGYDQDGNLSNVNVWRDGNPFAFAGGGNGWDGYSGNPASDNGETWITYSAQAGDSQGAWSGVIYHTIHIKPNATPTVAWDSVTPYSVNQGSWYTVRANGHDNDGNMTGIHIYRQWNPFAFALNGNGTDASSSNPVQAGAPGDQVEFEAEAHDAMGASSGYIYRTVAVNNSMPSSSWSPTQINTWVNGQYTFTASASDPDNNLQEMRSYEYAWEDVGGTYVCRQDYQQFDYTTSSGGPVSRSYTHTGGKPFKWNYEYVVLARDRAGYENWPWMGFSNILWVYLDNRPPQPPQFTSVQTRMQVGQNITVSADGTDPDANATRQWLWWQGPGDGPNDWHAITDTGLQFESGTGNTVINGTFGPGIATPGVYRIKSQTNDPYAWSVEVIVTLTVDDVPPNPPRAVAVTEIHTNWVYLNWTVSDSGNVAGQTISFQPTGGGTITNVGIGNNVNGASVTELSPHTAYNFWIRAYNSFGTYSANSNIATATTDALAPTITTHPANKNAVLGENVTFTVVASGDPAPTYQWQKNGVNIASATNTSLSLPAVQRTDRGTYRVVVTNSGGSVISLNALLNVGRPGDTDGDGMTDDFERSKSLNPTDVADGLFDADNDGFTNVAEYGLGQEPRSPDSGKSGLGGTVPSGWPSAGDSSNPSAVGVTTGQLAVDKNGAATYSIPLWVSPGTAGMQPQLALNYSSQGGPGIAGFGWSLGGISQISRGPATRAVDGFIHGVDFGTYDRFYLDGQRLIAVSGTDGQEGTVYRTEIDSFTKIVSHTGGGNTPDWFEAWTKAGLIMEFGHTADSAFTPAGSAGVLSWSISKIRDTKGNYMTFTYTEDTTAGTQVLSRVDYTGNAAAGLGTYAYVDFQYEDRPDWVKGYRAGCAVATRKRLTQVTSYYGATAVRTYTITYRQSGPSNRSLLWKLTEKGKDNTTLPDLVFDYEQNAPGWESKTTAPWQPPTPTVNAQGFNGRPTQLGTGYVDLNGDGRPDFVQHYWDVGSNTATRHAWLNTGSGWQPIESDSGADFRPPFPLGYSNNHDTTARFADLDGDGLVDILWYHVTGANQQEYGARKNTGSGWTDLSGFAPPFVLSDDRDTDSRGVHLIDLDADGRVDLIANGSGNVRRNIGTGWDLASQWSAPCNLAHGAYFVDLNGDGLPDIIQNWYGDGVGESGIWMNTGNGWGTRQNVPGGFPLLNAQNPDMGKNAPRGTEFLDLNGDGLVDLIARNDAAGNLITPTAWLNTGNGWVASSEYQPDAGNFPGIELRHDHESRGVLFIDVNGDGMADMVRSQTGQTPVVYYNTGHGWGSAAAMSEALQTAVYTVGWWNQNHTDLVDIDGDGIVDQCGLWNDNGQQAASYHNLSNPRQDRLKCVTNGFGVRTQITYKPLTDPSVYSIGVDGQRTSFPNVDAIGPMLVVDTVRPDDGTYAADGTPNTLDVTYHYEGLRSNVDRGSLGFFSVTSNNTRTGVVTTTTYEQMFPKTGMPHTTTTTVNGVTVSTTTVTYADRTPTHAKVHLVFAADTVVTTKDANDAFISMTNTALNPEADIDSYGNISRLVVESLDAAGALVGRKTTVSTYTNDTTNWFLGRLQSTQVTSEVILAEAPVAAKTVVRKSGFRYDAASGLMTDEAVEPVFDGSGQIYPDYTTLGGYDANTLRTHYEYDSFGNKTASYVTGRRTQIDNNGNVTLLGSLETRSVSTAYDTKGRLPISSTNALGHSESYDSYDQELGVALHVVGPNGLPTSWLYDGFGRKTRETRADGTVTDIRRKWAPASGYAIPAGAKYQVETESTGSPPSIEFFDAFGRVIRALGINGNGEMTRQDTVFDDVGRVSRTSIPDKYNGGNAAYWVQTTEFDPLDRPKTVVAPDDENGSATTQFTYSGLVTQVTDAKGRVSQTTKNARGEVVSSIRNLNAGASANDYCEVTYEHDGVGQVVQTIAAGVTTTLHYDVRGRKDQMVDADMGTWLYRYNAFGELIWQKDAKTQIVTMGYDPLGRMTTRTENEGTTTWTYDTTTGSTPSGYWRGKLATISAPGSYLETYAYDNYGRPSTVGRRIDGATYNVTQTYDSVGRPEKIIYPTGFQTRNVYNNYGFIKEVRRADSGRNDVYWEAERYAVDGRVDGELYGNGLANYRLYSDATGRLEMATIDYRIVSGPSYAVQQLTYTHDAMGNVKRRYDATTGRDERFSSLNGSEERDGYDGLDRLLVTRRGASTVTVTYDQKGNITSKSDAGTTYGYGVNAGPHALTSVSGGSLGTQTYQYDLNGNMTGGGGRSITWTSFNQPSHIAGPSGSSDFSFGAAHERVKQVANWGTTIYVGSLFERVTSGTRNENRHYIMGPTGRIALRVERSDASVETSYYHTDGLGSVTAVTDENGYVVKRFAFDPWGKRTTLHPTTFVETPTTSANNGGHTRAFTDHEQLDDLGLVHMNGRVYDPVLGRFLSADPYVSGSANGQAWNRYTYVGNNPLTGTDPSGLFSLGDAVKIVAVVAIGFVTAGAALYGYAALMGGSFVGGFGAALSSVTLAAGWGGGWAVAAGVGFGFGSGFAGSLLNGGSIGDAFKAGAIGGAIGALGGGVTAGLKAAGVEGFGAMLANSAAQGGVAEATGGSFRHGFVSGMAIGVLSPSISAAANENWTAGMLTQSLVGGTGSVIGGGKFANGAVSSATFYVLSSPPTRSQLTASSMAKGVGITGRIVVDRVMGENYGEAWRTMFSEKWVSGPTGGKLPPKLANGLNDVGSTVPDDAAANGMHSWHSGSNAYLAGKLGLIGAPAIFIGGIFHESPFDWGSFKAEQWGYTDKAGLKHPGQGTVNHALDSTMDIVANAFGMGLGYLNPGTSVPKAVAWGNYIPGPGDPDQAFGGVGHEYNGQPWKAWGGY